MAMERRGAGAVERREDGARRKGMEGWSCCCWGEEEGVDVTVVAASIDRVGTLRDLYEQTAGLKPVGGQSPAAMCLSDLPGIRHRQLAQHPSQRRFVSRMGFARPDARSANPGTDMTAEREPGEFRAKLGAPRVGVRAGGRWC